MKYILTTLLILNSVLINAQEALYNHDNMAGYYRFSKKQSEYLQLLSDSTFVYFETHLYYGKWEVKQDSILLYFDKRELDPLQGRSPIDLIEFKGLRIVRRNKLAWSYTIPYIKHPSDTRPFTYHEAYLKRFEERRSRNGSRLKYMWRRIENQ